MTFRGRVHNGIVVPEAGANLPEGAEVRIDVAVSPTSSGDLTVQDDGAQPIASMYDRYKSIIGAVTDLPEDFAANHDHYIHGQPKRQ